MAPAFSCMLHINYKSGIISEIGREAFCAKLHKSKSSPQHIGSEACTAALLSLSPMNTCLGSHIFSKPVLCSDFSASSLEKEKKTRELNNRAALLPCSQQRSPGLQWDLVQNLQEMGIFSKHEHGALTNLERHMKCLSCHVGHWAMKNVITTAKMGDFMKTDYLNTRLLFCLCK